MHTVVPLFDRGLMLVTDESTENNAKDWPKLVWILDARDETNLVPISTCPLPDHKAYAARGRFGAHNIHENVPLPTCWQSDQIVLGTFFNGGLRAYDISNPYQPQEIATFVPPPAPARRPARPRSTTCSSMSARSSTASTATSAGCTAWRWISDRHRPRSLPVGRSRSLRPAAEARTRIAAAGDDRHRIPRRGKNNAGAAISWTRRKAAAPR